MCFLVCDFVTSPRIMRVQKRMWCGNVVPYICCVKDPTDKPVFCSKYRISNSRARSQVLSIYSRVSVIRLHVGASDEAACQPQNIPFKSKLTIEIPGQMTRFPRLSNRVWDPDTGSCDAVLSGHGGTIGALCTMPSHPPAAVFSGAHLDRNSGGDAETKGESLIVSGSGDSTVRVWGRVGAGSDVGEWTCRAVLQGHRCVRVRVVSRV